MTSASGTGEPPDAQPRYTVAAVARRLGVAPATLRTWDRRYGLGPTDRSFGAHRRYTSVDLARLMVMRRLVVDGVSPAEAARVALARAVAPLPADADGYPSAGWGAAGDATPEPPEGHDGALVVPAAGSRGGGRVLPLPGAPADVRGLGRAAMALDAPAMTEIIRTALRERGVAATWHGLLVPVLTAVGDRWAASREGIAIEHLLSESALLGLREVRLAASPRGEPRVVLGCVSDEYHALPVHVLAAALAERDIPVRQLGAAVPPDTLAAALRRVRPAVLFCWSSVAHPVNGYLSAVPAMAPPMSIVVGGPGWSSAELPPRTRTARDVAEAVILIVAALGG